MATATTTKPSGFSRDCSRSCRTPTTAAASSCWTSGDPQLPLGVQGHLAARCSTPHLVDTEQAAAARDAGNEPAGGSAATRSGSSRTPWVAAGNGLLELLCDASAGATQRQSSRCPTRWQERESPSTPRHRTLADTKRSSPFRRWGPGRALALMPLRREARVAGPTAWSASAHGHVRADSGKSGRCRHGEACARCFPMAR